MDLMKSNFKEDKEMNQHKNKNIKWRMAVYIKKRISFRLGNALLNAIC